MHPCVSSIGLWAISASGTSTRAPHSAWPSACRPRRAPLGRALSILPMDLRSPFITRYFSTPLGALVQNVRAARLLHLPMMACYCYTTFWIMGAMLPFRNPIRPHKWDISHSNPNHLPSHHTESGRRIRGIQPRVPRLPHHPHCPDKNERHMYPPFSEPTCGKSSHSFCSTPLSYL